MRRFTGKRAHRKGSLTIEAALVLPIFLFAMICMISLSALLLFQLRLKEAMHEEMKLCTLKSITGDVPDAEAMGEDILEMVGDKILKLAPIEGDIDFYSDLANDEILSIKAAYRAKLYYDLSGLFKYEFVQQSLQHDFRGYVRGLAGAVSSTDEEEYVYVTQNSEVYHTDRECSHIRLKISEISADDLKAARSSDGSKYKSCEHCHSKITDGTLYITPDGDKYHNSLGCSGLKRSVAAIPLKEAEEEGLRCCSRCGG